MKAPVVFRRRSPFRHEAELSAVSFPHRECSIRREVGAGPPEWWNGVLEGLLQNVLGSLDLQRRRRPLYDRRSPTNTCVQQAPLRGAADARRYTYWNRPWRERWLR